MSAATPLFDRYAVTDICAGKHGGIETSDDANPAPESKAAMRARIVAFLRRCGAEGATWAEISRALGLAYSNSGRITELLASGDVVPNGQRRPTPSGCEARVIVAKTSAPI